MTNKTQILIVDDDSDTRKFLRTALANDERDIHEADTAQNALRAIKEKQPDILLLDIGLPGYFDGFSLGEALMDDPRRRKIRIVIVSGHDNHSYREHAERLGVVAYLVKPVSPLTLENLIADMESASRQQTG